MASNKKRECVQLDDFKNTDAFPVTEAQELCTQHGGPTNLLLLQSLASTS